jgi:putative addiction module component (TIGR02574 family)
MATLTKSDIAALSVDERLALIDDLWDSLEKHEDTLPTPDWHWPLVESRLRAQELNPKPTYSWETVRAEMEEKWLA